MAGRRRAWGWAVVLLAAALAAGGEDAAPAPREREQASRRVADPGGAFRIRLPAAWRATLDDGSLKAESPDGEARLQVSAAPKEAETSQKLLDAMIAQWKRQYGDWTGQGRGEVVVSGRQGIALQAAAAAADVRTVLWHLVVVGERHQVVMTLSCPQAEQERWADIIGRIGDSLELAEKPREGLEQADAPLPRPPAKEGKRPPDEVPKGMQPVRDPGGAFFLAVPEGWDVRQQAGGAAAADPSGTASVMILSAPRTAETLDEFARLLARTMKQQVPGWTRAAAQPTRLGTRPGLIVRAVSHPGGVPTIGHHILVLSERRQVCLSLTCPQQHALQWDETLDRIARTLRVP